MTEFQHTILPLASAFYETVEFYVAAAVVAAAVVAACVKPSSRGAVVTHLLAGQLSSSAESPVAPRQTITFECLPNGNVRLTRRGVANVGLDGAVSLAVSVNGFDITIEERLTPGLSGQNEVVDAEFEFDFMGSERYFVRYNSDTAGVFAVATVANRDGVKVERQLKN